MSVLGDTKVTKLTIGNTISTPILKDRNGSSGTTGQVLSRDATGIKWVDASTLLPTGTYTVNSKIESSYDMYSHNYRYLLVPEGSVTPSATYATLSAAGSSATTVSSQHFKITPTSSGIAGWISSFGNGTVQNYSVQSGAIGNHITLGDSGLPIVTTAGWLDTGQYISEIRASDYGFTVSDTTSTHNSAAVVFNGPNSRLAINANNSSGTVDLLDPNGHLVSYNVKNVSAGNIKNGVTILGVEGTYAGASVPTGTLTVSGTLSSYDAYGNNYRYITVPSAGGISGGIDDSGQVLSIGTLSSGYYSVSGTSYSFGLEASANAGWFSDGSDISGNVQVGKIVASAYTIGSSSNSGTKQVTVNPSTSIQYVNIGAGYTPKSYIQINASVVPSGNIELTGASPTDVSVYATATPRMASNFSMTGSAVTDVVTIGNKDGSYYSISAYVKGSIIPGTPGWVTNSGTGAIQASIATQIGKIAASAYTTSSSSNSGTLQQTITPSSSAQYVNISAGYSPKSYIKINTMSIPSNTLTVSSTLSSYDAYGNNYRYITVPAADDVLIYNTDKSGSSYTTSIGTSTDYNVKIDCDVQTAGWANGFVGTTYLKISGGTFPSGNIELTQQTGTDVTNYATASVAAGTAGTPTATKGTASGYSISVTPSVTNTTGYIIGSTITGIAVSVGPGDLGLTAKTAQTYSPSTSERTISAGYYTTGIQTISAVTAITNSTYEGYITTTGTARSTTLKTLSACDTVGRTVYVYPTTSIYNYWANTVGIAITTPSSLYIPDGTGSLELMNSDDETCSITIESPNDAEFDITNIGDGVNSIKILSDEVYPNNYGTWRNFAYSRGTNTSTTHTVHFYDGRDPGTDTSPNTAISGTVSNQSVTIVGNLFLFRISGSSTNGTFYITPPSGCTIAVLGVTGGTTSTSGSALTVTPSLSASVNFTCNVHCRIISS